MQHFVYKSIRVQCRQANYFKSQDKSEKHKKKSISLYTYCHTAGQQPSSKKSTYNYYEGFMHKKRNKIINLFIDTLTVLEIKKAYLHYIGKM